MSRRIIVYIATSADGYIARPDGSVDWLNRPMPKGQYGMNAFVKSIDTILWGRKTLGDAGSRGGHGGFGKGVTNYAFSRQPPAKDPSGLTYVREPIPAFASRLRSQPGKDVWMMGGAGIIASFLDAGEIDAFMIHIVPVFIGEGIPLVAPARRSNELSLRETKAFEDGVVLLHYEVKR
jgi:dihydrofolate reductase